MSTDASIDEPTAHTAIEKSCAPIWRSASIVRASATTAWVTRSDHFCTRRLVVVDGQHLAAEPVELSGGGGAEPAEADHEHRGVVFDPINQRWASLPDVGTAAGAGSPPGPRRVSLYRPAP